MVLFILRRSPATFSCFPLHSFRKPENADCRYLANSDQLKDEKILFNRIDLPLPLPYCSQPNLFHQSSSSGCRPDHEIWLEYIVIERWQAATILENYHINNHQNYCYDCRKTHIIAASLSYDGLNSSHDIIRKLERMSFQKIFPIRKISSNSLTPLRTCVEMSCGFSSSVLTRRSFTRGAIVEPWIIEWIEISAFCGKIVKDPLDSIDTMDFVFGSFFN